MHDCSEIITKIYTHPDINNLISKIHPESIRDDLRQEMAVTLMEQPCDRLSSLFAENNLVKYAIRICWIMATSKTNKFYHTFKRKELAQAIEYMRLMQPGGTIPKSIADVSKKTFEQWCQSPATKDEDHEIRLFNKFIELGSSRAVARFYNIPVNHVCNVVSKVKKELKQEITKRCELN